MKINKWGSLLLAAVMALTPLLSACGKEGSSPGTGSQGGEAQGEAKGEGQDEAGNLNPSGFPIVKEPISLTFFTGKDASNSSKFEETFVWKEYAKMSNIQVNFQLVPFESLTEKRNLALASGDYPDVFYTARLSATDLMKYGSQQEVLIPLNDLIDQYAPNFKKLLDQYPDLRKGLTMPDGNIYSFPTFYSPEFLPMLIGTPLWINKNWLDQLNMQEPQTIEDYYKFLQAVKTTDLNGNGQADEIPYSGSNINVLKYSLQGSWGLGNRGLGHLFVDMDPDQDQLRFFRLDPKYKEVLEFIHKLYVEGLIDPEIFTIKDSAFRAKGAEGNIGSAITTNPVTAFNLDHYIGLGALKGPHGDQLYSHVKSPLVQPGSMAITNKNKYPEATVRWIDYFYSDEGALFYFMGKEGVTYTKKPDGSLEYVEDITDNPNGLTMTQARTKYFTWNGGSYPGFVQAEYFQGAESLPNAIETGKKVEPYVPQEIWNAFNYTEEEAEFMTSVGSDIHTFILETEAKLIAGDTPFSEWDKYVDTVKKMGLDKYMEIEQAAYERYKNN